jgi:hypothetical protein
MNTPSKNRVKAFPVVSLEKLVVEAFVVFKSKIAGEVWGLKKAVVAMGPRTSSTNNRTRYDLL